MGERLEIYLSFEGNAGEVGRFYSKVFGKEADMMLFKDFPPSGQMGELDPNWVGHGSLGFDNGLLMFSDDPQGNAAPGKNFAVAWSTTDEARLREVWQAFLDGGSKIIFDLDPAFWAKLFGSLEDPFGVHWLLMLDPIKDKSEATV